METKQITLRSQTVRCSHCGEYYSVTYKYCPFCDAAREAEERKQAEKKNRKKALLGGLFGAPEPAPKKKKASSAAHSSQPHQKREPVRRESRPMDPVQAEPERSQSITEPLPRTTVQKDPAKKTPVKKDAPKKKESLFHKDHGHRRKTSELSEEEKAARLAEREARAAERKRERDRAAREAAVAAAPKIEAGPVFEEVTVPETFGFTEEPTVETDPAAFAQAPVSAEGPVVVPEETTPAGMEEIPVFAAPEATEEEPAEAAPETIAPVADTPPEDESERSRWEFLRGLEIMPDAPVVEVAVEGQPAAEPAEAQPVSVQPEVQAVPAEPVQTAQPVQETAESAETAAPEAPVQPAPVQSAPQETAVETEEDLDALLSEIRGMLADSPVPQLSPDQLKKPVQPAPPSVVDPTPAAEPEQLGTQTAEETPAPAAEEAAPAETIPAADEPTRIMPAVTDAADAVSQPADESQDKPAAESCETLTEPETPAPAVPDEGMPLETSMDQEEEPDILAVKPAREKKAKEKAPRKRPEKKPAPQADEKPAKKQKKRSSAPALIIVSLIIVAAAIFIVARNVVPAFQSGLFSFGQSQGQEQQPKDTAETLTLDQPEVSFDKKGATATLKPTFEPEGSSAVLTWTTSDDKIATVDENGIITAVAPGKATITAAMANGKSAACAVTCTWKEEKAKDDPGKEEKTPAEEGAEAKPAEKPEAKKPALSSNDVTLAGEGKTKQIEVTGAAGAVKWSSNKTDVAKVAEDGTVTAVGKGRATVTAEVDGQKLNCEVRCIW